MLMAGNLANVGPSVGGFGRVLTGADQKTNPGGGKKCPRVELAKGCGHAMVFLMMLKAQVAFADNVPVVHFVANNNKA